MVDFVLIKGLCLSMHFDFVGEDLQSSWVKVSSPLFITWCHGVAPLSATLVTGVWQLNTLANNDNDDLNHCLSQFEHICSCFVIEFMTLVNP